ncbi:unnamed protein product [Musa hybrid cultivar]
MFDAAPLLIDPPSEFFGGSWNSIGAGKESWSSTNPINHVMREKERVDWLKACVENGLDVPHGIRAAAVVGSRSKDDEQKPDDLKTQQLRNLQDQSAAALQRRIEERTNQ